MMKSHNESLRIVAKIYCRSISEQKSQSIKKGHFEESMLFPAKQFHGIAYCIFMKCKFAQKKKKKKECF